MTDALVATCLHTHLRLPLLPSPSLAGTAPRCPNLMQKEPTPCCTLTANDIQHEAEYLDWNVRFQQTIHGNHKWYLNGAHDMMILPYTVQSFIEIMAEELRFVKRDCVKPKYTDLGNQIPGSDSMSAYSQPDF